MFVTFPKDILIKGELKINLYLIVDGQKTAEQKLTLLGPVQ
jgi:hypothetical protein